MVQKDVEVDKEREWAAIRTIFAGSRLIDPEKVKADPNGNKPVDEEGRLKMQATHKCPYCGEDVLEEGYAHCSAECLLGSTHNIADEIVKETMKDLWAMCREKCDDPVNHPSHYTAYKGLEVVGEDHPEQFLVWVCYITDNYGNPLVVKVVSTKKKALEWLSDSPHAIGKKADDEVRGNRFVESFVVEAER